MLINLPRAIPAFTVAAIKPEFLGGSSSKEGLRTNEILPNRPKALYTVVMATAEDTLNHPMPGPMHVEQLMLQFESLGDNCEFGLVQRNAGAEPISLLRFSGFYIPIEQRLDRLVTALLRRFDGLGALDTITPYLAGEPGGREWLVRESAYDLMYHTFSSEGSIEESALREREGKRLTFLRNKLLADLEAGEKIWVWRSEATSTADQIEPLYYQLRALGPNQLLWVVEAEAGDRIGLVERLDAALVKGYVKRFAPYDRATEVSPHSWYRVCEAAYPLLRPSLADEITAAAEGPLTAMDHLRRAAAPDAIVAPPFRQPQSEPPPRGVWTWLRGMVGL
jgi:hypothetical protein